jgi:D-proline reductase (dithiol) PrdB
MNELAPESIDVAPISYITRAKAYYGSLGYEEPYRWAHHVDAPFTPLPKPVAQLRIGILTTAAPYRPEFGDQGPWAAYNAEAKFRHTYTLPTDTLPDLRISHIGYDRTHTSAEDQDAFFPLKRLREAEVTGRISSISPRFYGIETTRSQRQTSERDAPEIARLMREDGVEAAILVAT